MATALPKRAIKGELNRNRTVFCPCAVSLGKHPPAQGHCQAWVGLRIDERASEAAYDGLINTFSGRARHLRALCPKGFGVSGCKAQPGFLCHRQQVPPPDGRQKDPRRGHPDQEVAASNAGYRMGPDNTFAQVSKGRVWDFEDRSAKICQINWHGTT